MLGKNIRTLYYAPTITSNTYYIEDTNPGYVSSGILRKGMTLHKINGSGSFDGDVKVIDIDTDGKKY